MRASLFVGLITAAIFSGGAAAQQTIILRNATLIDGSGSPPQPNVTITIERGRIAEIARHLRTIRHGNNGRADG